MNRKMPARKVPKLEIQVAYPDPGTPEYEERFRAGQVNENGIAICGANDEGRGLPCPRVDLDPLNQRCPKHGGQSLKGYAHPNHKRYVTPTQIDDLVDLGRDDPDFLSNVAEIEVVTARMGQITRELSMLDRDDEEWKPLWREWDQLAKQRDRHVQNAIKLEQFRDNYIPKEKVRARMEVYNEAVRQLLVDHLGRQQARDIYEELKQKAAMEMIRLGLA